MEHRLIRLRRQAIEQEFGRMNDRQREAVLTTEGAVLVLAGAGSGKTTVIINRIANLIRFGQGYHSTVVPGFVSEEDCDFLEEYVQRSEHTPEERARMQMLCAVEPAHPWNIIAITFTNKAAGELKERLAAMLQGEDEGAIWASTFHSACVRILRRDIERLGYQRNFTIYDTDDSLRVIKDTMKELNIDEKHFTPKSILGAISKAKNDLLGPEEFEREYSADFRMRVIAGVYRAYQKKVESANALDFDDLIMKTVELLRTDEEVRDYYQRKFRYVMVDEYQDTNHSQYILVSLLAGGYHNICVVGDDDQSIYRFRGATIENILNFEQQFTGAKVIRLEQNYRSTGSILDAANQVIVHNTARKRKTLWTQNPTGEKITLYQAGDDQSEAMYIANTILEGVKEGRKFNDYAILYRINAQSGLLERTFSKMGLPHRIIGGVRFYDRKEIKDIMSYLALIANPNDDLRLKRIINEPKRGIGGTTVDLVEALGTSLDKSMYEVCSLSMQIEPLQRASSKLYGFYRMMEHLGELRDTMPLSEFIDVVIRQTGYEQALKDKNDVESETRLENIKELISNAVAYERAAEQEGVPATLDGFLEEVALVSAIDNHDPDADAVSLMTVHSAKGLEFPVVFLYGMEENLFPSSLSAGSQEELEEERRLMYVAVTRAKEKLVMTCAQSRILYGKTISNPISRFVKDIPAELLDKQSSVRTRVDHSYVGRPSQPTYRGQDSMLAGKPTAAPRSGGGTSFAVGDQVRHKVFGDGMVLSVKKMANDTFLEVSFHKVGTKKLMANFAKLTKVE
ncbi:MAG: ATP-dependent helicase [Eubacteriales bacterium]|jgi:DNA helicase-2/ATP-dependent DNA helicase PcrA